MRKNRKRNAANNKNTGGAKAISTAKLVNKEANKKEVNKKALKNSKTNNVVLSSKEANGKATVKAPIHKSKIIIAVADHGTDVVVKMGTITAKKFIPAPVKPVAAKVEKEVAATTTSSRIHRLSRKNRNTKLASKAIEFKDAVATNELKVSEVKATNEAKANKETTIQKAKLSKKAKKAMAAKAMAEAAAAKAEVAAANTGKSNDPKAARSQKIASKTLAEVAVTTPGSLSTKVASRKVSSSPVRDVSLSNVAMTTTGIFRNGVYKTLDSSRLLPNKESALVLLPNRTEALKLDPQYERFDSLEAAQRSKALQILELSHGKAKLRDVFKELEELNTAADLHINPKRYIKPGSSYKYSGPLTVEFDDGEATMHIDFRKDAKKAYAKTGGVVVEYNKAIEHDRLEKVKFDVYFDEKELIAGGGSLDILLTIKNGYLAERSFEQRLDINKSEVVFKGFRKQTLEFDVTKYESHETDRLLFQVIGRKTKFNGEITFRDLIVETNKGLNVTALEIVNQIKEAAPSLMDKILTISRGERKILKNVVKKVAQREGAEQHAKTVKIKPNIAEKGKKLRNKKKLELFNLVKYRIKDVDEALARSDAKNHIEEI